MKPIVLASTSPYRKALFERLQLTFTTHAPNIDESPLTNELPEALVTRLSQQKAQAVAIHYPNAVIIGSDQVAVLNGKIIGKPGTHDKACEHLRDASGKTVIFLTGLCVLNSDTGEHQTLVEPFEVKFKQLTPEQIEHYLLKEKPYDCAGSFKCEGLGIALFESMKGNDPTSLIGLPLIQLTRLLHNAGIDVL